MDMITFDEVPLEEALKVTRYRRTPFNAALIEKLRHLPSDVATSFVPTRYTQAASTRYLVKRHHLPFTVRQHRGRVVIVPTTGEEP